MCFDISEIRFDVHAEHLDITEAHFDIIETRIDMIKDVSTLSENALTVTSDTCVPSGAIMGGYDSCFHFHLPGRVNSIKNVSPICGKTLEIN